MPSQRPEGGARAAWRRRRRSGDAAAAATLAQGSPQRQRTGRTVPPENLCVPKHHACQPHTSVLPSYVHVMTPCQQSCCTALKLKLKVHRVHPSVIDSLCSVTSAAILGGV